jgi:mono/diheme cytochrome c family protein
MNRWMRRGLWASAAIVVAGTVGVFAGLQLADAKMNRRIELPPYPIAIPTDAAALERGRYLFESRGCIDCHGLDGAGRFFVDEGGLRLSGSDITPAPNGIVAGYAPEDWVRAIRHGVKPDGRPLRVMPSQDYNRLTDADLGALVAYVKSLPPAQGAPAVIELPLPVRVLLGYGFVPNAAQRIDHSLPPQQPVPEGATIAHGQYVAAMCIGCHGEALAGGRIPGAPPAWPPAPDLTFGNGGVMAVRYADQQQFAAMFQSGKRPDGTPISVMPFESLEKMSDVDVSALWLYLRSLPPRSR